MRYLVISDIHANLEALDATLAAASGYDQVLVLGDLVGYGADPNAVIDRVRALPLAAVIRGNHDKVAAGIESTDGFNFVARAAVVWTASQLTAPHLEWLTALPAGPLMIDEMIEICHGTPYDEDVYVFDDMDAFQSIGRSGTTSIVAVAPGISEALINTAAGLFAAIPALIAYNYFLQRLRAARGEMEEFSLEFMNLTERNFT